MAAIKDNTGKILNLQNYVEKLKNQLTSMSEKRVGHPEFKDWANLEIKRTLKDIEKLRMS